MGKGGLVREPELQPPHRVLADACVEPLDEELPRRVELVAPAVVLHQEIHAAVTAFTLT